MRANGVIKGKLTNLERVISQLRSLGTVSPEALDDWILCSAVERKLQIAVEIVVDICHRLHSLSGKTPASSGREAVEGCVEIGVLKSAETYSKMIGFRNLIVHRYEYVDTQVLAEIMNQHLGDFELFRDEVLDYVS
jgi:uncharacterized protein YutE (UPF0331/DUF86 family)